MNFATNTQKSGSDKGSRSLLPRPPTTQLHLQTTKQILVKILSVAIAHLFPDSAFAGLSQRLKSYQ